MENQKFAPLSTRYRNTLSLSRLPRVDGVKPELSGRITVLSNRGPMRVQDGAWVPSSGGLVTALDPLLRARHGTWISGKEESEPSALPDLGYQQRLVALSEEVQAGFYSGFSNGVLWPTLHGFPAIGQIDEAPWDDYEAANRAFAEATLELTQDGDTVWVHDYHLMRTPLFLRQANPSLRIGWFCHIPWPDADQFAVMPWRSLLLEGVLASDLVGFHSARYASHFLECAEEFAGARIDPETGHATTATTTTQVIVAPIGIPTKDVRALVESEPVRKLEREIRRVVHGRRIILGVDRLDYTKGIPERLSAFERLLEQSPNLVDEVVFVQVVVPSRETVAAYADLKDNLDRLVGRINGQFSHTGRIPVHYLFQSLTAEELYAHYRAADVALVTPLRDGMNLVALEYIQSRVNEDGALILSEFAGAAEHLQAAFLVNPYNIDGLATTLTQALQTPTDELKKRMRHLRHAVAGLDVHEWADRFLRQLAACDSHPATREVHA